MSEYVSRCFLTLDGKEIADFKTVTEEPVEHRFQVPLMHKTGFGRKTERFQVSVGYVVPSGPEVDWRSVEDATLVVEKESGGRTLYTGVCTLESGAREYDGDKEMVQSIKLAASGKTQE